MSDFDMSDFDMSDFDIYALEDFEEPGDETILEKQDELVRLFHESERGQAFSEKTGEAAGGWARHFLYYGYSYLGVAPTNTSSGDADEIVNDLFPAKITIFDKEEARWAIPELIEFWHFLEETFDLDQADQIIPILKNAKANFPEMMVDPSRASMAKSFMLLGNQMGYDMTDPAEHQKAMLAYNSMVSGTPPVNMGQGLGFPGFDDDYPDPGETGEGGLSKKQKTQKKKKRKQQKASKRKNRKK